MKGRIKKKLKKKTGLHFSFSHLKTYSETFVNKSVADGHWQRKLPLRRVTPRTALCGLLQEKETARLKKKSGWESQFCTNFLKKLFWIAHIQCGLIFGCWSLCRVSSSRHVDDTYCEIVIFILVSLGLFHGFILKVKPESDHREEMSEERRCAAKEPRLGFEARTAAARTQLLYSSTNWASGAPHEILICLLSNKPLNSLTFLD